MKTLLIDLETTAYQIPEFEAYYVTKCGRVFSTLRGHVKELSLWTSSNGYLTTKLGRYHPLGLHRIMAMTFIGPSNGLDVNHIDGNKKNNSIDNLEYVSRSDNIYHSLMNRLHDKEMVPVVGVNSNGDGIYLRSQSEGKYLGFHQPNIGKVLAGKRKTANGFSWELF